MKAVVVRAFGGPEVLTLEEVPDPTPGPGQVVVRVEAAGVNPVDTYVRSGSYAVKPSLPYIPGSDFAGTVEALGPDVTVWKRGDRVYSGGLGPAAGAYAPRVVSGASFLHPLPANISFAQGAALGVPYATAWRALFMRAHIRAGETLLVHGASGGVGIAAVQIGRATGLRVIGTAGTPKGMSLVREQGAEDVVDHHDPTYTQALAERAGGRGYDVIVEMLANVNLDRDLDLVARFGRVIVVGNRGRVEIDARKTMGKDASILGMTLMNASADELRSIHAGLVAGLENGTLKPVVGRELPLAQATDAHVSVMEPGALGKIVLIP